MCGRATLKTPITELRRLLGLSGELPELPPRFNIAPSQPLPIIRRPHRLELLRWGLDAGARRVINVRAESVARAPQYRDSFRSRRCLVIVDGFYEWQHAGKAKQPFYIVREDGQPFALAGIYEHEGCAVLTVPSLGPVAALHDRMPLIITPSDYDRWVDPRLERPLELVHASADGLTAYPVSTAVNAPANDNPRCIEPLDDPELGKNLELF
jgi:putative SOS response-associated peptidase YedK